MPAERQGDDQDAAITLLRCEVCGVYVTGTHTCTRTPEAPPLSERMQLESGDRHGAGATTGTGGTRMGEITGEAPNIEAARDTLAALQGEADRTVARVDQLSASLHSADLDSQTLSDVAAVLEAADVMKAAAHQALTGLASRHQLMEEAVNNTAHAAKTDWYRHG